MENQTTFTKKVRKDRLDPDQLPHSTVGCNLLKNEDEEKFAEPRNRLGPATMLLAKKRAIRDQDTHPKP